MTNFFARRGAAYVNEMNRSLGALLGIAQGLLCDNILSDDEIVFLDAWLTDNDAIATAWPGDVIHARVKAVLLDGVITEGERTHLVGTLQQLVGGALEDLAKSTHVTSLAFDAVPTVSFPGSSFCFTGDFVFAPREVCAEATELRGGTVQKSITKALQYLVVGGLGSKEWKHGSFGTKISKAMHYKGKGLRIYIVHEDQWAQAL